LTTIGIAHHTYNIQLTKNNFNEKNLFQNSPVQPLPAAALPSPERKVRKTSHQEQINKQNETKRKAIHAQAHARATTLVAEERMKPKENRWTTAQVIAHLTRCQS
jgi:hypothetical protein